MNFKEMIKKFFNTDFLYPYIVVLTVFLSIRIYQIQFPGDFSNEHARWAEFGSYFGGIVGATSAVLAFFILLKTLNVNQKELSETRRVIEKQNFESTFMQLLNQMDTEINKTKMDLNRSSIKELRNSIEEVIIVGKPSGLINTGETIESTLFENKSYFILKQLIDFLQIFLEFISSNRSKNISNQIHIKLFISKLSDDLLFILIGTALAQTKNNEIREAISQCELIKHIEFAESRENLQTLSKV